LLQLQGNYSPSALPPPSSPSPPPGLATEKNKEDTMKKKGKQNKNKIKDGDYLFYTTMKFIHN